MPGTRSSKRASVDGAGVGGLVAAIGLAAGGFAIDLCERATAPGSKLREFAIGGARLDAGRLPTRPTVYARPDTVTAVRPQPLNDTLSRAIHESLRPDRFTSGWVQAMLPFRLPRVIW